MRAAVSLPRLGAISTRHIAAKKRIFPLDILIWKLNRKSRNLFGVLDNQPFSRLNKMGQMTITGGPSIKP
jgi:hypothetical protein